MPIALAFHVDRAEARQEVLAIVARSAVAAHDALKMFKLTESLGGVESLVAQVEDVGAILRDVTSRFEQLRDLKR